MENEKWGLDHDTWGDSQRNFAMDQVINYLVSATTPSLDSFIGDSRLIEWCTRAHTSLTIDLRNLAAGWAFEDSGAPWAADLLSALKANAETATMAEAVDFHAAQLADLKDQADTDAKAEGLCFYQSQLASSKQQAQDEADKDFASFKHQLKIDTEARKERARREADAAVAKMGRSTRPGRRPKMHPAGSRPASRTSSCTPSSPSTPTQPLIPLPVNKTPTKADFPVGGTDSPVTLVERYSSEVPEQQSTTFAKETQVSSAESVSSVGPPLTAPVMLSGADRALASVVSPTLVADTVLDNAPPAPPSEFDRIMMALSGINGKVEGLAARVLNLEDGPVRPRNPTVTYHRADVAEHNDVDMPTIEYDCMSEFDPDAIACDQVEVAEGPTSYEDLITSLYLNIAVGIPIGDPTPNRIPSSVPNQDRFEAIAESFSFRFKIDLNTLPFDGQARMNLSTFFWDTIKMEDKIYSANRAHLRPHTDTPADGEAAPCPTVVEASPMPSPPSRPQYGRARTAAHFDADSPISHIPNDGGWTVTGRRKNIPIKPSFATIAGRTGPPAPTVPPTLAQAAAGLTRESLMAMTKANVISAYTLRFGGRLGKNHTKEGVVEAYLAKAAGSPATAKPTSPQSPKILQSIEFTVVRDLDAHGLKAQNCLEGGKRRDAASIVRQLQRLIRQELPPNIRPRAELIGGRWSSQSSSNFVLTFGGQPSNDDVLSLRSVFLDFFGAGSLFYPARGYTRVTYNLVPIVRSPSGALPSGTELTNEMELNPVCQNLTIVSPPR